LPILYVTHLLHGLLHAVEVVLQRVFGLDAFALLIVLGLVLLRLLHHALDVVLGEASLVVADGDLVGASSRLVGSSHVEDP